MGTNRLLKSRAEAKALALEIVEEQRQLDEFQEEVKKLAHKRGLDQVQYELPMKRQRVLDFMHKNDMGRLDLGEDGYVNCIQAVKEHVWIATKADIGVGDPSGVRSLRSILSRELFMRATKRVADPKAIEQLIEEGEITEEEIAPAHYTRFRAPYIRFEKGQS